MASLLAALAGTLGFAIVRFPFPPDLLLLPVSASARGGRPVRAMLTGLVAGLIEDSLTTPLRLFGLHAFTKILIGYVLASLEGNVIIEKPAAIGALLAAAAAVESGILVLLLWLLRNELLLPDISVVLLRAVMTGWAAAIVAALARLPVKQRFLRKRHSKLVKEV